jgi:hypothetical protein
MTGFVPPPSRLFIWLLLIAVYREFKCARQDAPEVLREAKQGGNGWLDNTKMRYYSSNMRVTGTYLYKMAFLILV